ncbi:MAG: hypothetical protein KDC53_10860 [Saprospiraceae bacterium]|nr:hypothetical protein [Saprospiraceae bacterium]
MKKMFLSFSIILTIILIASSQGQAQQAQSGNIERQIFDENTQQWISEQFAEPGIEYKKRTIYLKDQTGVSGYDYSNFSASLEHIRGIMVDRANQQNAIVARQYIKLDKTLHDFLQTEFMLKYRELKIEAEALASTFKAEANHIPPQDVAKVKRAYIKIADEFNRELVEIKRDFLDRKKMKMIRFNKDVYANSLQYRLRQLQDIYANDFQKVVAEVTGSDEYAAIPFVAILSLIKLAQDFTEYLINANYEARRVKEEHLNQYLIEPYRFRDWVEIEMIEGDIYNNFNNDSNMEPYNPEISQDSTMEMNPFEDEPVSLPAKTKVKKNQW